MRPCLPRSGGDPSQRLSGWQRKDRFHLGTEEAIELANLVRERGDKDDEERATLAGGEPILVEVLAPTTWRLLIGRKDLVLVTFRGEGGGEERRHRYPRGELGTYGVTDLVRQPRLA